MKQNLLLTGALLLGSVAGCSDEDPPQPELSNNEIYPVSFTVGNLSQIIEDYPERQPEAPVKTEDDFINFIDFFVYDSEGELAAIRQQDQYVIGEIDHFGDAHFLLPKGDFKLIVVGSQYDMKYTDSTKYSTTYMVSAYRTGDIFYKELDFKVTGEEIIESVKVERIVGMLEFQLTETPTDLVAGLYFIYRTVVGFPFDKDRPCEYTWTDMPQISGQLIPWQSSLLVFRGLVLPDRSGKFDTEPILTVHQARANAYDKYLKGVIVQPNKKTIVTGSLVNSNLYHNFYVDADSVYGDTTYINTDDLEITY